MIVINLNSKFDLSPAQISYAESVIINGDSIKGIYLKNLINKIPIFLLSPESMPNFPTLSPSNFTENALFDNKIINPKYPSTEYLGFYKKKGNILGINKPIIGLCPERIVKYVKDENELIVLLTKVLIHEFAHAKMDPGALKSYKNKDEFYQWMEESMANYITLSIFENFEKKIQEEFLSFKSVSTIASPFGFVRNFISKQPDNYKLGLDLFKHDLGHWHFWRDKKQILNKDSSEKQEWLDYVKRNVGRTNKKKLSHYIQFLKGL
jgi:predicted SprT family Zn-dependent metalloprotease